MNESRRSYPRYAVEVEVELSTPHNMWRGRTRNVSRGGVCATVSSPVVVGVQLRMALMLVFDTDTVSEPLILPGRAVWCTPLADDTYQLGAVFLPLTHEQTMYLNLFLRYLDGSEDDDEFDNMEDDPFTSSA